MSKHISFLAVPAHGHVNPSLSLVAELVRRGYRVTFAINSEFAKQVTEAGATAVLYDSTFPSESNPSREWPDDDDVVAAQRLFHDEFIAVTPRIEAAYADDLPDLVVYDIGAWQAPVLAKKWGVPAIQLSPTFVAYEGWAEDFGIDLEAAPDPAIAAMEAELEAFAARVGVDISASEVKYQPKRCVVTIPRAWQLRGETVDERYTFVGPSVDERAHQGEWQAPGDKPVLLVSLGSAYTDQLDFYRQCVEAFTGMGWHVLLSVGRFVDPRDLGEVPDDIEVVRWVPQVSVLSQASAFVTHGGMGSTMEGLYFGVPMVAVPQAVDQPLNGARLVELGLGAHLPKDEVTPEALRAAVSRVSSDPQIAANLAKMRVEIRAAGGARAAADVVESYL
ncbi:macrolide family glycosyltransferase [Actinokineospora iranica]|uniref:Glycosyltransferase, MGT family n=1 Tax=Actinokineospora iranica TaxID=1271860 RepID=A0A1G6P4I3_9PSEU|nr:macrolide family glycosyltransferase [Actinokineospora iranica]SDC75102.1 glycosyltransferase, MGT family [Actinokineospora iranica]